MFDAAVSAILVEFGGCFEMNGIGSFLLYIMERPDIFTERRIDYFSGTISARPSKESEDPSALYRTDFQQCSGYIDGTACGPKLPVFGPGEPSVDL